MELVVLQTRQPHYALQHKVIKCSSIRPRILGIFTCAHADNFCDLYLPVDSHRAGQNAWSYLKMRILLTLLEKGIVVND